MTPRSEVLTGDGDLLGRLGLARECWGGIVCGEERRWACFCCCWRFHAVYRATYLILPTVTCRYASKKTGGSTRNKKGSCRPKHRGLKVNEGIWVSAGSILVLQRHLRFHPGLNVGFGKNGTLFALENGHVMISCEKVDLNLDHTWIQREYAACRYASKKTGGSTRNKKGSCRPKHRGLKVNEGIWVSAGSILVLQRHLRFHPGLNVGFGKNGTLFALENGHVMISCEKVDLNLDHTWIQREYAGRDLTNLMAKCSSCISRVAAAAAVAAPPRLHPHDASATLKPPPPLSLVSTQ
ncbi:hypothetical protein B566_EDAN008505 [Ephemera danica]|nr:hypothetical protein B566_EDAN008505 [Ephemera danica]